MSCCLPLWFVGLSDRDDWKPQVAQFLEEAVQRRLVGHGAVNDGGAIAHLGEAQSLERGSPSGIEVPLDAELVTPRLIALVTPPALFTHRTPFRVHLIALERRPGVHPVPSQGATETGEC